MTIHLGPKCPTCRERMPRTIEGINRAAPGTGAITILFHVVRLRCAMPEPQCKRLRDSGRAIGRPGPPGSAGNDPSPSGPDREAWVRVRHSPPGWLRHRVGPGVVRQWPTQGLPDQRPQVPPQSRRKAQVSSPIPVLGWESPIVRPSPRAYGRILSNSFGLGSRPHARGCAGVAPARSWCGPGVDTMWVS